MTLAVETADTSSVAAGGATFAVGWSCAAAAEIVVTVTPSGAEDPVLKVDGVDYDVSGDLLAGGGEVIFRAGFEPDSGDSVRRYRDTPLEQPDTYGSLGSFDPAKVMRSFDRVYRVFQEVRRDGVSGGGAGGVSEFIAWDHITSKPSIISLIAGLTPAAGKVIEFTGSGAAHMIDTPTGGGGGGGAEVSPPSLASFGTIDGGGSNTSDNDTAFAAAEASAYDRVWVPEGIYKTTRTLAQLTKRYEGPGTLLFTDLTAMPANYQYLAAAPSIWAVQGATGWFRGDQGFADGEYRIIGPGVRESTTARYFESPFIPHHAWMDVYSGQSGLTARLTVAASTGSADVTVNGIASADVLGKQINFTSLFGGGVLDVRTVTAVVGNVLTLNAAPSANHPIGTVISTGPRTWNGYRYIKVTGFTEGDVYGDIIRMKQSYQPKAGQEHFFTTSTVGIYGGDVIFTAGSAGTYCTGTEFIYEDAGNDVAVIAHVDSFIRDNDTGARGVVWGGHYLQSTGAKPSDFGFALAGKWRVGLDTVRADLTNFAGVGDNANVAINTKLGHRWVMNSTNSNAARGGDDTFGNFYGNVLGDMFIESATDGTSDYIALRFNRAAPNDGRLRVRPQQITVNKPFLGASSVEAAMQLVTNSDTSLGQPTVVFGSGLGHYITFNIGANRFEFWRGGSLVTTIP